MPRSRSRSPRIRDSHERRHRSRRHDEPAKRRDGERRERGERHRSDREERGDRSHRERSHERRREGGRSNRENERSSPREHPKRDSPNPGDERINRRENPRARFQPQSGGPSAAPTPGTGANAPTPASEPPVEKEAPNFAPTGLLAAATNTVNGVVLKYSEPAEARKPPSSQRWRLFVFKDQQIVDTVDLNGNSCWLVGRDRAVADLAVDHPSCSKQHAVLQFRHVVKVGEFGDREGGVKPYIIDLESANGTRVGKVAVPGRRYLELKEGDLITFGLSTREYVLMLDKD